MENIPSVAIPADSIVDNGIELLSAMVIAEMVSSKSEARRAVEQGGVSVDGEKISDVKYILSVEQLKEGVLVKKGKKVFKKITM